MDEMCEKIREQLPELIDAGLSPEKAVELEQHRSRCKACNEYFEGLQADDKLLTELVYEMQPRVARFENIAMDALGRRKPIEMIRPVPVWTRIARSRTARVAAMVSVVAAVLIGAAIFKGPRTEPVETVKGLNDPDRAPSIPSPGEEPDLDAVAAAELAQIHEMFAGRDVAGLIAMLSEGQPQSKLVAASYLAQIGDARALGALGQLSATWTGDAANNPFAEAAAQIMARLQQKDQEAEPAEDDKAEAIAETTTVKAEENIGCKGVVVDENGRAISDARVLLYHNRSTWGLGNRVLEEAVSVADGSFVCKQAVEFSSVREHSYAQDRYILMATHPDHALGWKNITQGSEQEVYRIIMTTPSSRTITVTDHDGNPLAGVRVWPYDIGTRESPNPVFRDYLYLPTDVGLAGGTTDSEGRAVITNLPNTECSFYASFKGYATGLAFPNQTTIRLSKGASVSGWVLAEGDKPVSGATIKFSADWMHNYFLVVSDDEGYFHIEDLPAQGWDRSPWGNPEGADGSYTITLKHESCSAAETNITLLPAQSVDDFVIQAYGDTTLVECQIVESGTDVPVAGARISGTNRIGRIDGYSDSNGIFAVRVLPGPVSLSFHSPPDGVYVLEDGLPGESSIRFDAAGEKMRVTLKTPPIAGFLRSVPGIVLDPDGQVQSVGKTVVHAAAGRFETSTAGSYVRPVGVDSDGHFELKEVPAGRKLRLYVTAKDGSLAATEVVEIPDDPDWSGYLGINLRATQSASVIVSDEAGEILADREFNVAPMVDGERIWTAERKVRTDENGLLEMDGIVPGLEYLLSNVEPEARTSAGLEATGRPLTLKMVLVPSAPL